MEIPKITTGLKAMGAAALFGGDAEMTAATSVLAAGIGKKIFGGLFKKKQEDTLDRKFENVLDERKHLFERVPKSKETSSNFFIKAQNVLKDIKGSFFEMLLAMIDKIKGIFNFIMVGIKRIAGVVLSLVKWIKKILVGGMLLGLKLLCKSGALKKITTRLKQLSKTIKKVPKGKAAAIAAVGIGVAALLSNIFKSENKKIKEIYSPEKKPEKAAEPVKAAEPEPVKAAEPEPVKAAEPEPVKAAEPEPVKAAEPVPPVAQVGPPPPAPVYAPAPAPPLLPPPPPPPPPTPPTPKPVVVPPPPPPPAPKPVVAPLPPPKPAPKPERIPETPQPKAGAPVPTKETIPLKGKVPITTEEIKAFQKANGLTADGIAGPMTIDLMIKQGLVKKGYSAASAGFQAGVSAMLTAMDKEGIKDPMARAQIMAQAAHESDSFKATEEYASGAAYEGRPDLGNNQPGDGVRFKGRGFLQTTGRVNYTDFKKEFGIDVIEKPELLALPENAAKSALLWFKKNAAKVKKLSNGDWTNTKGVTAAVNGGYNGLDDRIKYFNMFKDDVKITGLDTSATRSASAPTTLPATGEMGQATSGRSLADAGQTQYDKDKTTKTNIVIAQKANNKTNNIEDKKAA